MTVRFAKISPGGNDTIIVESPVPAQDRATIAQRLMHDYAGTEQVGFLSQADSPLDARLDMMGGELCINGLRSAGALVSLHAKKAIVRLASSGTDQTFTCTTTNADNSAHTSIAMDMTPHMHVIDENIFIMHMDGISHLYIHMPEAYRIVDPLHTYKELSKKFEKELSPLPAFGIIPYQLFDEGFKIVPVVHVRDTHTTVPETGCGSGSIGLAMGLNEQKGMENFTIYQPSGVPYLVEAHHDTTCTHVLLDSDVKMLLEEEAEV